MPTTTAKAKPARKLTTKAKPGTKPVTAKPVAASATPAKPVTTKPETTTPVIAKPAAHITRTIATIARNATNFAELSDRDAAYFTFYKALCRANGGKLTVAAIVASGRSPAYNGSCKPHDAGVIVRLTKAGLLTGTGADDKPLSLTATGNTRA